MRHTFLSTQDTDKAEIKNAEFQSKTAYVVSGRPAPTTMPAAPIAKAHLAQYIIQSSDVLAEMRVNVLEQDTQNVLWYKEREMTEHEIVESIVESATNCLRWTIHRPKRGWYLRIRSPSFPPGTFIPFLPPPRPPNPALVPSPAAEGTLAFAVRTALPTPEQPSPGEVRINIINVPHSYPPTPPAVPSPSQSSQTLASPGTLNAKLRALSPSTNITHFTLFPSLPVPMSASAPVPGALSRALSYLKPPLTLPIRATSSFTLSLSHPGDMSPPLLTFTDRTSTFSVLTTGLLEVNKGLERQMGVEPAFWIAVSLAYLEFLADRDSYLAAANG